MATTDTGIVNIHGKAYQTVAYRVGVFRQAHGFDLSLVTEIVTRDVECVVMKATISDEKGRIIATGHSEEYRSSSQINKTSALENAETSAIGRALAALGLGGTEFASANEVENAIHQQRAPRGSAAEVMQEDFDRLPKDQKQVVIDTATLITDYMNENRIFDAFALYDDFTEDNEKSALWGKLGSAHRRALKEFGAANSKAAKG